MMAISTTKSAYSTMLAPRSPLAQVDTLFHNARTFAPFAKEVLMEVSVKVSVKLMSP